VSSKTEISKSCLEIGGCFKIGTLLANGWLTSSGGTPALGVDLDGEVAGAAGAGERVVGEGERRERDGEAPGVDEARHRHRDLVPRVRPVGRRGTTCPGKRKPKGVGGQHPLPNSSTLHKKKSFQNKSPPWNIIVGPKKKTAPFLNYGKRREIGFLMWDRSSSPGRHPIVNCL